MVNSPENRVDLISLQHRPRDLCLGGARARGLEYGYLVEGVAEVLLALFEDSIDLFDQFYFPGEAFDMEQFFFEEGIEFAFDEEELLGEVDEGTCAGLEVEQMVLLDSVVHSQHSHHVAPLDLSPAHQLQD